MSDHDDDRWVIDRLRAALDEAAAGAGEEERDMMPFKSETGVPRRWLAIAAATVLIVGAAVFALSRRSGDEPTEPAAPATTEPAAPVAPTTIAPAATSTTVVDQPPPWFGLQAPGFTAGDVTSSAGDGSTQVLTQVWQIAQDPTPVYLTFEQPVSGVVSTPPSVSWTDVSVPEGTARLGVPTRDGVAQDHGFMVVWSRADGTTWVFRSQGLTTERLVTYAQSATQGSGLPVVLTEPGATVLGVGVTGGPEHTQTYTGDGGTVDLWVESGGCGLCRLISAANIIDTTVAGTPGYAALMDDNSIEVTWDAGSGWWGHLTISPELSRGADGIIAEVVSAPFPG
jgi:hypothetical protein